MRITFDNIIFALQQYGGISVVWNWTIEQRCLIDGWSGIANPYGDQQLLRFSTPLIFAYARTRW